MKASVLQRASQLGFDDCRVTTAAPPESLPRYSAWLEAGKHGAMEYLVRQLPKRGDPQAILPGARSIVTLAASYFQNPPAVPNPEAAPGLVARYARANDYHDVLWAALKELTQHLDELGGPGTRSLYYADTGPILERDLAQRSGIGFVGKHTNIIHRKLGNWIFLAEILTTLELPPDAPEQNRCGTCTRCITACPTAAITAPFQLDARRCISYLTIELKGSIPEELRPMIGNRVFGCDDCLAACPWNRFAREGQLMRAQARPDLGTLDLVELLKLDEAEFRRRFSGTPMARSKRRGLLRNACVALGNTGTAQALPALEAASRDPDPIIAEHALWALRQIEHRSPRDTQVNAPPSTPD